MIVVTGAAGFIGSCMISYLQEEQYSDIVSVDDFSKDEKALNFIRKEGVLRIDRQAVFKFIKTNARELQAVVHLGARTDTVDPDPQIFLELNINYSKQLFDLCSNYKIPLIYASSAATYGDGQYGFDDAMEDISVLRPLNEYGRSKQIFDDWVLQQEVKPPSWVGLKFFNVYGPNEYHKGRMASVIFHAFHQIRKTGKMKLFRSHREDYENGMQLRDFIYVKDVCDVLLRLIRNPIESGIYNLGTGQARSFLDLVFGVFDALKVERNLEFIDIPKDIRENYQYFTEANMSKLKSQYKDYSTWSLEGGIEDYVVNYLLPNRYM